MKATIEQLKAFGNAIIFLKYKAGELGLHKTMQSLEPAVKSVTWEIAEMVEAGKVAPEKLEKGGKK